MQLELRISDQGSEIRSQRNEVKFPPRQARPVRAGDLIYEVLSRSLGQTAAERIMKTVKSDEQSLRDAAQMIKEGNAAAAEAEKKVDAGKEILCRWLKEKREIDINTLSIGEMVLIENVCLVEIGSMMKFDEKGFLAAQPTLYAQYKRALKTKKFKALV